MDPKLPPREQGHLEARKTMLKIFSASERLTHLLSSSSLDESSLGHYCREKGLYSFQLTQWKEEFMAQKDNRPSAQSTVELRALQTENKVLKQELRRKDSALAETAALLVLKKKAHVLWGEAEEA